MATQQYSLRRRPHDRQMPDHTGHLADKNFFIRMLYKDSYWLFLYCNSVLSVSICVLSYVNKEMTDWSTSSISTNNRSFLPEFFSGINPRLLSVNLALISPVWFTQSYKWYFSHWFHRLTTPLFHFSLLPTVAFLFFFMTDYTNSPDYYRYFYPFLFLVFFLSTF